MNTATSLISRLHYALLLLSISAFSASAQADIPPHQMLESVTQKLFDVLETEQDSIEQKHERLYEVVERVLLPHVDLGVMSRYVLGKYWRTATKEQRQHFSNEFKILMVRFYVSALLDDPGQIRELLENRDSLINYLPVSTDASTKKTRIRAEVHLPNGGPRIPVSFNLFIKNGQWMMYDVNVDGISLVSNYRSSFATEVRRDGLDALIERLVVRNEELLQNTRNKQAQAKTAK